MTAKKKVEIFRCGECTSGEVIVDITIKPVKNTEFIDFTHSVRKCNECKTQYGLKQLEKLKKLY